MALDASVEDFCHRWRQKANSYGIDRTEDWFDRFFTLWVLFNALYTQVAVSTGNGGLADDSASQDSLLHHLNARVFVAELNKDAAVVAALAEIQAFLQSHRYFLKLDRQTGARQPDEDDRILANLQSHAKNDQGRAVLEALYCVRCNLFQGHKEFDPVQVGLLRPMIVVLEKVIDLTLSRLQRD